MKPPEAAPWSPGAPPLRVAHVTHWFLPSNETATIQLMQTLSALAQLGVCVDLLTPRRPWTPPRSSDLLRRALADQYEVPCEFQVEELPSLLPGFPGLSRLLHAGLAVRLTRSADVVHTRDLEAAWLALRAGRRVVFESFRLWTRRSAWHRRRLLRMAARPRFLGLVLHSGYAAERYREDGFPSAKLQVIYNGFDAASFANPLTPSEARSRLGLPEQPTVVFLGVIARRKRVNLLLDAAERTPELHWVLGGDSELPEARPLVERASRELPNVSFPGFVSGAGLAVLLQAGDVLVIPPSADPLKRFGHTVLPIKLFQYLAAGRPIVTGEVPDTAELLEQDRNCVRIRPDDPDALAAAVRALSKDPARRERLGRAARADSARFTWAARGQAFLAFLQRCLHPREAPARV